VITGLGLASPIGNNLDEVEESLRAMRHGIVAMPEWEACPHLRTRLGGAVKGVERSDFPRKAVRTMGRVGVLSLFASDRAIADAKLASDELRSGRVGLAYGSTHGSSSEQETFVRKLFSDQGLLGIDSNAYLKFMSHTCSSNLAAHYGIRGRIVSTCAACVSASQAIGFGYESIRFGLQEVMLCGGAEELHFTHAAVFDLLFATSTHYNDRPERSPRPFDAARDGLVVSEGAATLVLESLEHARARGAEMHAEVIGYGTNCDGSHVTNPSAEGMAGAMRLALADAGIPPAAIDYVNAHATGTEAGDIAESHATLAVLGGGVAVSSTKSYTGHTLGAAGGVESIHCLVMMRAGFAAPTRNLDTVDPRCARLDYVREEPRQLRLDCVMNNNFAFGGINTSLIFRRL
jgi:3-oxoacyl-[acyl-carrier-protein] synthase II